MFLISRSTVYVLMLSYSVASALADLNPYKVLGVDKRSGLDEIKRAYKQLALQYHPDRNRDDGANDQFILVNEAYQILSTAETRRLYDLFGYAHVNVVRGRGGKQRHGRVPEAGTYFYSLNNTDEHDDQSSHHRSSMRRFSDRMSRVRNKLSESIRKRDVLPVVSVLGTITFLLLLGFLLSYFDPVSIERRRRRRQAAVDSGTPTAAGSGLLCGSQSQETRVLHKDRLVHELKPQTYQALVRNLKPGHRSVILLVDNQTKDELVQRFGDIVYRYRKNKSLLFAYANVDLPDRLDWYRRLLQQTLVMVERRLHLIPHKCCGTVLSLNGFRHHYSIYHAMHRDSQPRRRRTRTRADGSFLGFDDSEDDDDDSHAEDEFGESAEGYSADVEWNANNPRRMSTLSTSRPATRNNRNSDATAAEMSALTASVEPQPAAKQQRVGSVAGASSCTTASCSSGGSAGGKKNVASEQTSATATILTPESDPPSYEDLVKRNLIDATSADYLLAGLPQWLDRLFDGKLQNYYINTWPMLK